VGTLQSPFVINTLELFVTASVGVCLYPAHGRTAAELQQRADSAMYQAKTRGKNCVAYYDPATETGARDRMDTATRLRRAVERNELELHYQPQVDLDGRLRGFEALLRWRHPTRGLEYPGSFIPIAEETGLIVPIGAWVIQEACRHCAEWTRVLGRPLKVAVNVSALQFYFSDLTEVVRGALAQTSLDPRCLEIELTESLLMRDSQQATAELDKLRKLGVTLAIDDFGTGYSSLSYLRNLPVDLVKIDRSFLHNLDGRSGTAIIGAITAVAHALGLRVIAEGVERPEQMNALRELKIDSAQGFLLARPTPVQHLHDLLHRNWSDRVRLV
jgi:EAL domain-containing protein (putative c-di-GMP-specific phosphodiesterase class I)